MVKGEALLFLAGQFFFQNFLHQLSITMESNVLINRILFLQDALL